MIGLGKKQGGLYTLQSTSFAILPKSVIKIISNLSSLSSGGSANACIVATITDDSNLWHCRLGHPST